MNFSFPYIFLFLFFKAKLYCQDVLVKRDSSKIQVKLIEVRTNELKYKLFSYQDGPNIIISKKDVAYVIYSNGVKEIFNISNTPEIEQVDSFYLVKPIKGDTTVTRKYKEPVLVDYIKFNVQLGVMMQSSSSNYTRREPSPSHTSEESYTSSSNKYLYNYNIGFSFLFGKSPYVKHVIGVNYLRSTGEYDYSSGSIGSNDGVYINYLQNYHYVSKIDFVNVVTGLRFKTIKRLYIEPLVSINIAANSDVRYSGTDTRKYISGGPTPYIYKIETEYYSNQKVSAERSGLTSTISLSPKISYDFNFKKQTLGVYISYNLAFEYRLPWMMAGITYYPFKKLR